MSAQLPLGVQLRDDATLDNFLFPAALEPLQAELQRLLEGNGEGMLFLHGPVGSGRSHLLQAACHRVEAGGALYLPLDMLREQPAAEVLADMEQLSLVALDNMEAIAGVGEWEEALFHFYNRARAAGCRLLCSAAHSPRQLPLALADLRSRLGWELVFQLPPYSDEDRLAILRFRAARRGMEMSDEVARYLLSRAQRDLPNLIDLLDVLDRETLVRKRALTIPLVRECLGW